MKSKRNEVPKITFDEMPDSGFVRANMVCALCSCSPATLWRWVKSGTLPEPHRLSARFSVWNVGALREAMARMGSQQ